MRSATGRPGCGRRPTPGHQGDRGNKCRGQRHAAARCPGRLGGSHPASLTCVGPACRLDDRTAHAGDTSRGRSIRPSRPGELPPSAPATAGGAEPTRARCARSPGARSADDDRDGPADPDRGRGAERRRGAPAMMPPNGVEPAKTVVYTLITRPRSSSGTVDWMSVLPFAAIQIAPAPAT